MKKKLQLAIQLIKQGEKEQARGLLRELVNEAPQQLNAWFWLADAVPTNEERIKVLQEAITHHLEDKRLLSALEKLQASLSSPDSSGDDDVDLPESDPADGDFLVDEPVVNESLVDEPGVDEPSANDTEDAYELMNTADEENLEESFSEQLEADLFEEKSGKKSDQKPATKKSNHRMMLFIVFVLAIIALATIWFFRDSLLVFLPENETPVALVATETPEPVVDTPTGTTVPTDIVISTQTPTEIPTTETSVVGGEGGTATPILITTPTNTAVVEEGKFVAVRGSKINDITWSRDGDYFAVAGDAGITIYNGETFTERVYISLDPVVEVLTVTFSPENKYIAAGFYQSETGEELITRAKMWQVNDGAEVMSFDYKAPRGDIDTLAFSIDGETLLMNAKLDVVLKWRVSDGALLDVFTLSASEVDYFGVEFSPDRLSYATYSKFDRVRIYDTLFGEQTAVLGEDKDISDVTFSANSQYLAVMFEERPSVYLWDLPSKEALREWNTFGGNVITLAFDADNQTLAVGTDEDLIKFYQIRSGEEQRVISRQISGVTEMEFAPDDILFAVRNETEIQVWHLLTDTLVATFRVYD